MGDNMISLTQMLAPSAESILFKVSPNDSKEPHTIVVVFDDIKKATVYYEEIKQVFKDGEMSLELEKSENKLRVYFLRTEQNLVEGNILVDYDESQLESFNESVVNFDAYALIFGAYIDNQLVVTLGLKTDRAIVFVGYKIL